MLPIAIVGHEQSHHQRMNVIICVGCFERAGRIYANEHESCWPIVEKFLEDCEEKDEDDDVEEYMQIQGCWVFLEDYESLAGSNWIDSNVLFIKLNEIAAKHKATVMKCEFMNMFDVEKGDDSDVWNQLAGESDEEKRALRAGQLFKGEFFERF